MPQSSTRINRPPAASNWKRLFPDDSETSLDFSQAPDLIRAGKPLGDAELGVATESAARWERIQCGFLARARRTEHYPASRLERSRAAYSKYFDRTGGLRGSVLDIGGGWGLYRQWWEPDEGQVYVVHDPGVERYLQGAHDTHHQVFARAFELSMTFVEGVGESLPYRNAAFDTCVVASALDHCADPSVVLREAHRCLRPAGRMLLLQGCHGDESPRRGLPPLRRFLRMLAHPLQLATKIRSRLLDPPMHMHHFSIEGVKAILDAAGFAQIEDSVVIDDLHMFEAQKGSAGRASVAPAEDPAPLRR